MSAPAGDRFEDLPVWQKSHDLAVAVHALCLEEADAVHAELLANLYSNSVRVGSHIAQGYGMSANGDLLFYLGLASGEVSALRSDLHLLQRLPGMEDFKERIETLIGDCVVCSDELSAWKTKLQQAETRNLAKPIPGVPIPPASG